MQIKIAARHGHVADDTQARIREKAEKLLHYFDRITMIEVTIDLHQKEGKWVEFRVELQEE